MSIKIWKLFMNLMNWNLLLHFFLINSNHWTILSDRRHLMLLSLQLTEKWINSTIPLSIIYRKNIHTTHVNLTNLLTRPRLTWWANTIFKRTLPYCIILYAFLKQTINWQYFIEQHTELLCSWHSLNNFLKLYTLQFNVSYEQD